MSVLSPSSTESVRNADCEKSLDRKASHHERSNGGFVGKLAKDLILGRLKRLHTGVLNIEGYSDTWNFGEPSASTKDAKIYVHDQAFFRKLMFGGALGAAEAYIDGLWTADDLTGVFQLMAQNQDVLSGLNSGWSAALRAIRRIGHLWNRNTLTGSRKNISEHYDLGNDFYALFLDETMTYSCGFFDVPNATLKEASLAKYERICQKLQLSQNDHILEIGTGWGGFAHYAAERYRCRVTTTTISKEQYEFACRRIEQSGLSDRVTVLCEDYRVLNHQYDKLVSIEMIEAVGHEFLEDYFRQCSRLLKADGLMVLQAITMPDHRYDSYRRSVDFIQRYIFPGGCLPSISAISGALKRETDFRVFHLEDFGPYYAETLAQWRQRFVANVSEVRNQGFDEPFIRKWEYYLCYCEAAFLERQTGLAQIVFTKPQCRIPSIA